MVNRNIIILAAIWIIVLVSCNIFLQKKKVYSARQDLSYTPVFNSLELFNDDVLLHIRNVEEHFNKPSSIETRLGFIYRDDDAIKLFYLKYCNSDIQEYEDIGNLCMGMISLKQKLWSNARDFLSKIKNHEIDSYHLLMGEALLYSGNFTQAKEHLLIELNDKNNLHKSSFNLIKLHFFKKEFHEITPLLSNLNNTEEIPKYILRWYYFSTGQWLSYIRISIDREYEMVTVIAGVLVAVVYIFYILFLTPAYKRSAAALLAMVIFSGAFSFVCFFWYDWLEIAFDFRIKESFLNDFVFCFLGIGAFEELVKVLPFMFIFLFLRKEMLPIEYMVYVAASAIGFSMMENMLYFNRDLNLIDSRGLICVSSHIFDSSIIAYFMVLAKFRKVGNIYTNFIIGFVLAALIHGLYDFWLMNEAARHTYMISYFMVPCGMLIWVYCINNTLNYSIEKFNEIDVSFVKSFLLYGISSIVLISYIVNSYEFGVQRANETLLRSLAFDAIFVFLMSTRMGDLDIFPGYWNRWNMYSFFNKKELNKQLGKTVVLNAVKETKRKDLFPLEGSLSGRASVEGKPTYYIFKPVDNEKNNLQYLFQIKNDNPRTGEFIVVNTKSEDIEIEHHQIVSVDKVKVSFINDDKLSILTDTNFQPSNKKDIYAE
ncbi:MAG: PrsW family intramembrane metalloprotease [Cytophagaceae bacterium]